MEPVKTPIATAQDVSSKTTKPQTFREFHDEMRKYRRRVFVRLEEDGKTVRKGTYVKPKAEGEVKGKQARKAAKKARHAAMRSA